jgi:hypothetical protein
MISPDRQRGKMEGGLAHVMWLCRFLKLPRQDGFNILCINQIISKQRLKLS